MSKSVLMLLLSGTAFGHVNPGVSTESALGRLPGFDPHIFARMQSLDSRGQIHLHAPRDLLTLPPDPSIASLSLPKPGLRAGLPPEQQVLASYWRADVYERPSPNASVVGYVRRGYALRTGGEHGSHGCHGHWHAVDGGYVCLGRGFRLGSSDARIDPTRAPAVSEPLPYRYAQVVTPAAWRLKAMPSPAQVAQLTQLRRNHARPPAPLIDEVMRGDYFVALDVHGRERRMPYWRTVSGHFIARRDLKSLETPAMRGELLQRRSLTEALAFVYGPRAATLYCPNARALRRCGRADVHARFRVARHFSHAGRHYVQAKQGFVVARERVRVVEARAVPAQVPQRAHWIHIDLSEQSLVAYEGQKPVYATLVSTGKTGFTTPVGHYRVREKHISTTMNGSDPREGRYDVGEVPWVLY
ncbi:MAG: L,D-transpeptidase, partial [Polyangiales bacterium]